MMSTPKTATARKLLGLDEDRLASHQEAIPLPYARGHARLGVKWITPVIRRTLVKVQAQGGKGSSKVGSTGESYDYYGDLAGAIQLGVVSRIKAVYIDNGIGYEDPIGIDLSSDGATPLQMDQGFGEFYFYAGSTTQGIDTNVLNIYGAGGEYPAWVEYPAWPGVAYCAIKSLYFGENRTSAPTIDFITESVPDAVLGLPDNITEQGVNPVTCIAEILTNKLWGAGLDSSELDAGSFTSVANAMARNPEMYYISPVYTGQVTMF